MSRFIEGEDRQQVTLLPECLDDYVAEDNTVRVVDAFISELDLVALGFGSAMRAEKNEIVAKQQGLARPEATCGALIPIRKNAAWWELTQDERRSVFEQSKHVQIGLQYLPAVARKLHHCRDLSENEPFDFLNWFEYAPIHEVEFNRLLSELRASEEWKYVDREVDIRLTQAQV